MVRGYFDILYKLYLWLVYCSVFLQAVVKSKNLSPIMLFFFSLLRNSWKRQYIPNKSFIDKYILLIKTITDEKSKPELKSRYTTK